MIVDANYILYERDRISSLVMTSGGYDPMHPGHVSYLREASQLADFHIAVVNGDEFLISKKGRPFMRLIDRVKLVDGIKGVDLTFPFQVKKDLTVNTALELIRPDIFAKGGVRKNIETIPEWDTCQRLGIKIVTNVGDDKEWSSTDYLSDWAKFSTDRNENTVKL